MFRPNMMKSSTSLRLFGIKNCPCIAMNATATKNEIKEVISALGLRIPPVVLATSPVLPHIKFSILRRPSNNYGLDGYTTKDGKYQPGLMDLLLRVYLKFYLKDLELGLKPKKAIIFCRGNGIMGEVYSRLMELTKYRFKDCRDAPFVMNHSSLLPPTEKVLTDRREDISLYLSSNKMLMGIDLAEIDVIIFLRPYNQLSALIQGAGRGGRRIGNSKRRRVQVYLFFNSQDFSDKNVSQSVKSVCLSKDCTRNLLKQHFVGDSGEGPMECDSEESCCNNCDAAIVEK